MGGSSWPRPAFAGVAMRLVLLADPATAGTAQLAIVRAIPSFLAAAVVGALVVRYRPGNRVGPALLVGSLVVQVNESSTARIDAAGRMSAARAFS